MEYSRRWGRDEEEVAAFVPSAAVSRASGSRPGLLPRKHGRDLNGNAVPKERRRSPAPDERPSRKGAPLLPERRRSRANALQRAPRLPTSASKLGSGDSEEELLRGQRGEVRPVLTFIPKPSISTSDVFYISSPFLCTYCTPSKVHSQDRTCVPLI